MKKLLPILPLLLLSVFASCFGGRDAKTQPRPALVYVAPFEAAGGIMDVEASVVRRMFIDRLNETQRVKFADEKDAEWIVRGSVESRGANTLVSVEFFGTNGPESEISRARARAEIRYANIENAKSEIEPLVLEFLDALSGVVKPAAKETIYKIGDRGPGGGLVFFIFEGNYWECSGVLGSCTWEEKPWIMAQKYRGGGFSDWHIANISQLRSIYQNLYKHNLGGFPAEVYWTQSETDSIHILGLDFVTGEVGGIDRSRVPQCIVLAVRSFKE